MTQPTSRTGSQVVVAFVAGFLLMLVACYILALIALAVAP